MEKKQFFTAVACTVIAAGHVSCNSPGRTERDPAVIIRSGFEESIGWGGADSTSLTQERAHGGQWSVQVKPSVPFSYTYARSLGAANPTMARQLVLTAWVWRMAVGSAAKLVVEVDSSRNSTRQLFYRNLAIAQEVPKIGEWKQVTMTVTLPATVEGGSYIKVYLWNDAATSPTYLDDISLNIIGKK